MQPGALASAAKRWWVPVSVFLLSCVPVVTSYEGLRCDDETAPCGKGFACVDGICRKHEPTPGPFGCFADEDCDTGVCDAAAGYCVACLEDGDCAAGAHCLRQGHFCVQCTRDAHCPDQTSCNSELHVCQGSPPPQGPLR